MIYYGKTLFGCGPKLTAVQNTGYGIAYQIKTKNYLQPGIKFTIIQKTT